MLGILFRKLIAGLHRGEVSTLHFEMLDLQNNICRDRVAPPIDIRTHEEHWKHGELQVTLT